MAIGDDPPKLPVTAATLQAIGKRTGDEVAVRLLERRDC